MNWKLVLVGGVVLYIVLYALSFITVPLIHDGILKETYQATPAFWRPELMQEPPNTTALLPRWITTGLIGAFIVAGIYGQVRSTFTGPGWQRGLKFGFVVFLIVASVTWSFSGFFNLPDKLWTWWTVDSLLGYLIGGAVLGFVADKLAPRAA
jgi:hypothetical protein